MMSLLLQYLAPLLAAIGLIAAAFGIGHTRGKAKADVAAAQQRTADNEAIAVRQVNEARAATTQQLQPVKEAANVQAATTRLNDGDAADELQSKYSRD